MRNSVFPDMKLIVLVILVAASLVALRAASPRAQVASPPSGGLDPSKLPDIEGIHLGMSVQGATGIIETLFPPSQLFVTFAKFQDVPDTSWVSSIHKKCQTKTKLACNGPYSDEVTVWFSTPPNKQVVVAVERDLEYNQGKRPTIDTVTAALRQKYGQEFPQDYAPNGTPGMSWVFDEQGKLISPSTTNLQPGCAGSIAEPPAGESGPSGTVVIPFIVPDHPVTPKVVSELMVNPCRSHIYVLATLSAQNGIVRTMYLKLSENAEDARDAIAGQEYLDSIAVAQKKR
jgi:hypothetical protein